MRSKLIRNFNVIFYIHTKNIHVSQKRTTMIKFIIILAFIFYILPKLIKWGLKGFITTQMNKAQQDIRHQQKAYQSQQKYEGQIDVDYVPKKNGNKSENSGSGEYVDYEEVK